MKIKNLTTILLIGFVILLSTSCDEKAEDPTPTPTPTNSYSKVKTGYFYHNLSTLNCAWNLATDASVSKNDAASTQSILAISSGDFSGDWESGNGTTFVKASSSFNYTSFTDADVVTAYNLGPVLTEVYPNPQTENILIAKNGSIYYVIKVTNINPSDGTCACAHAGKLTFES